VGCTSVLRVAHKYKGALAEWIVAMRARKPERVVAVALARAVSGRVESVSVPNALKM